MLSGVIKTFAEIEGLSLVESEVLGQIVKYIKNQSEFDEQWTVLADRLCAERSLDQGMMSDVFDHFMQYLSRVNEDANERHREFERRMAERARAEVERSQKIIDVLVEIGIKEEQDYVLKPELLTGPICNYAGHRARVQRTVFFKKNPAGDCYVDGVRVSLYEKMIHYIVVDGKKRMYSSRVDSISTYQKEKVELSLSEHYHEDAVTDCYSQLEARLDICRSYKINEDGIKTIRNKCIELGHFPFFLALYLMIESAPESKRSYAHDRACVYEGSPDMRMDSVDMKAYSAFRHFVIIAINKLARINYGERQAYKGMDYRAINSSEECCFSDSFMRFFKYRLCVERYPEETHRIDMWAYSSD